MNPLQLLQTLDSNSAPVSMPGMDVADAGRGLTTLLTFMSQRSSCTKSLTNGWQTQTPHHSKPAEVPLSSPGIFPIPKCASQSAVFHRFASKPSKVPAIVNSRTTISVLHMDNIENQFQQTRNTRWVTKQFFARVRTLSGLFARATIWFLSRLSSSLLPCQHPGG